MGKYDDVSARPEWARGEFEPGTLCAAYGHRPSSPVKAVAVVTEWFGSTRSVGEFRGVQLPHPVCGRHLNSLQQRWETENLRREKKAATERAAIDLKKALEYFRERTGVPLDAGLVNERSPSIRFTLDATQLRHLADSVAVTPAVQGKFPYYQHECGHIEAFTEGELAEVLGGCDACESGSDQMDDWQPLFRRQLPETSESPAATAIANVIQFPGGRY